MITGYNTDVRHGNRIYHVQTEDKGLSNPKIETLIYVGGEILDSYRSSYEDLTAHPPVAEAAIQARMDEQHRTVIRDIKNGKYDQTPNHEMQVDKVFNDRPLDQAILEYLQLEGDVDTLELVMEAPIKPTFGATFRFQVRARLCHSQGAVSGADVSVKLVSSLKKAVPLVAGKTDGNGVFKGEVQMPPSQPGQCALVVSCLSDAGFDELKSLVVA